MEESFILFVMKPNIRVILCVCVAKRSRRIASASRLSRVELISVVWPAGRLKTRGFWKRARVLMAMNSNAGAGNGGIPYILNILKITCPGSFGVLGFVL